LAKSDVSGAGRSDGPTGGYIGIYTLPKSGHVNFSWGDNNVKKVSELVP